MEKTETVVKTTSGLVQYFHSEEIVLAHYNCNFPVYEIRNGENGRELWHKGHNYRAGVIETIAAREI